MIRWVVSILVAFALGTIAIIRTENFSVEAISGPLTAENSSSFSSEVAARLAQPYRYLSHGRQAYVFISEDGQTVLKFFKRAYHSMPWYGTLLPIWWREQEIAKREKRHQFYLQSYQIAEKEFKEETGLLFVHFGQLGEVLPRICLVDKASRSHEIDLNQVPFVLQKKGEPFYPFLLQQRKTLEGTIDLFLSQIAERIAKGIADGDQDVQNNFGWVEGKLLHFDAGRFFYDETLKDSDRCKHEWWRATHHFRDWLEKEVPEVLPSFDEKIRTLQEG